MFQHRGGVRPSISPEIAPMAISTVPQLFQALRAASLLTNAQVDVLVKELLPRATNARALARELLSATG